MCLFLKLFIEIVATPIVFNVRSFDPQMSLFGVNEPRCDSKMFVFFASKKFQLIFRVLRIERAHLRLGALLSIYGFCCKLIFIFRLVVCWVLSTKWQKDPNWAGQSLNCMSLSFNIRICVDTRTCYMSICLSIIYISVYTCTSFIFAFIQVSYPIILGMLMPVQRPKCAKLQIL